MYSRTGASAYKEDLHNIIALCEALGNPHKKIKSIHIAGTNGKGSTSHMIASVLQTAGFKTGLYTSPHLKDFGERIRINGEMIEQHFVINFIKNTEAIIKKINPSFFELTVAMAFCYFVEKKVDVAVIETGLGGRLDSTNIITPELSVITNIGLDHTDILGSTLEKIATEKAGIIKPYIPVVIGEVLPQTEPVFRKIGLQQHAPLIIAPELYHVAATQFLNHKMVMEIADNQHSHTHLTLDLTGIYQTKNIITAYAAVKQLIQQGWTITAEQIEEGFKHTKNNTGLKGRWDVVQTNPVIIMDVGHNDAGFKEILHHLNTLYPNKKYHFIIGFVKDKDIEPILTRLPKSAQYYFTHAHIPRALPASALAKQAKDHGLSGEYFNHVNAALHAAKLNAAKEDIILICGSFFVLSEVSE